MIELGETLQRDQVKNNPSHRIPTTSSTTGEKLIPSSSNFIGLFISSILNPKGGDGIPSARLS